MEQTWIVVELDGLGDVMGVAREDESGEVLCFESPEEAKMWAEENCPWDYRIC